MLSCPWNCGYKNLLLLMGRVARIVAAAGFTVNKMLKEGNVLFNDAKDY